jgi:hypothetical protein
MTNTMRRFVLRLTLGVMTALSVTACSSNSDGGPLGRVMPSNVTMNFLTSATIRAVIVEVTGPGINPPIFANFPIGNTSVATGTLAIPAGTARRIVVSAMDTSGVITHRADTTITIVPGTNPNLQLWLEPLVGTFGITVSFGGIRLVVPDTTTRNVTVGDVMTIQAHALRANSDTVPSASLMWASNNLAVATVQAGRVTFHRVGEAIITVSFNGIAVAIRTIVSPASPPPPAPSGVTMGTIDVP